MTKLTDDDWAVLLPATAFRLGTQTLQLRPLGLAALGPVASELARIYEQLREKDIDQMAALIVGESPALIAAMSGLDVEDVKRLPGLLAIGLATACIDVNIKSSEDFLKNLLALAGKITKFGQIVPNFSGSGT